jgi:hypothetical protein
LKSIGHDIEAAFPVQNNPLCFQVPGPVLRALNICQKAYQNTQPKTDFT